MKRAAPPIGADLCRPLPLLAAAVLGANDHLLEGAGLLPGSITGKLGDVAGLFLFPILLCALLRALTAAAGRDLPRHRIAGPAALATAAGFAAVKLWPGFNALVGRLWGGNVMDPGDLWTLPMVALAWLWLLDRERRRSASHAPAWLRAAALLGALAVCAATPAPRYVRNFPRWVVISEAWLELGCGRAQAWVSKSGKTGVGLSIQVHGDCDLRIERAELVIEPAPAILGRLVADDRGRPYLAFEFDNEALWNAGRRAGTFVLTIDAGAGEQRWELAAEHRLEGYHRQRFDRDGPWSTEGR